MLRVYFYPTENTEQNQNGLVDSLRDHRNRPSYRVGFYPTINCQIDDTFMMEKLDLMNIMASSGKQNGYRSKMIRARDFLDDELKRRFTCSYDMDTEILTIYDPVFQFEVISLDLSNLRNDRYYVINTLFDEALFLDWDMRGAIHVWAKEVYQDGREFKQGQLAKAEQN